MVEIYKSLPVSGARRLPYKDDQYGTKRESWDQVGLVQTKTIPAVHASDDKVHEQTALVYGQSADHGLVEQLVDQNRLLSEEISMLKEELGLLQVNRAELLAHQVETEEKYKNKGYEVGYRDGCDKAAREERDRVAALVSAMEVFNHRFHEDVGVMQKDAVLVAYEALVLIIGEYYKTPEFLKAILESAVAKVVEKKNIRLHLSKTDCDVVNQMLANKVFQFGGSMSLVADERVKKGGCIIETENGIWDARLDSQLERIKDALVIAQDRLHT